MPNRIQLRPRLLALALFLTVAACDTAEIALPPSTSVPAATPFTPPTMAQALSLRSVADDIPAAEAFRALFNAAPSGPDARAARVYLAEMLGRAGRWPEAAEHARAIAEGDARDELQPRALFLLARAHEEAGAPEPAVAAYERYRTFATPLEPYARLRQAALERALGRNVEAAANYEAVAASDIARLQRATAYEGAIAARIELAQQERALALYRALLDFAEQPAYRAEHLVAASALADTLGEPDQARQWRREAAAGAPGSAAALDAVTALLADPSGALPPADAARVFVAHEQWSDALGQLDQALAAGGDETLALRRERALVLRAQGDYETALAELAAIALRASFTSGSADPDGDTGRQALLDWTQTLGQSGDVAGAITGYQEYAAAYPADPRTPEALRRAVILLETQGDAEGATVQRLDFARRYPAAEGADRALMLAGLQRFEAGERVEAAAVWEELRASASGPVVAQAGFWLARAAAGDVSVADAKRYPADAPAEALEAVRAADPDSYYAARAGELLGDDLRGDTAIGAPVTDDQWRDAEAWLAAWSAIPTDRLASYQETIAGEPAALRATALADAGLIDEAIGEWRGLLETWRDDPLRLYHAARAAYAGGITYVALDAAERLVALAHDTAMVAEPQSDPRDVPVALRLLIYPTPFRSLVVEQAAAQGLEPLALYALLRQESHFNPAATSWVGARGLAQVMPSTADGIAAELGMNDFHPDDLYRPAVSIRFGAHYLRRQLDNLSNSLPGALAAYNGGAGNAWRWAGGESVGDSDLFVERIDFAETRNYVKLVYGYHGAYRRLYAG